MQLNKNVKIEEDDAGVWVIICNRQHEFLSRADARALKRYLDKYLAKKPLPREKRQRQ